MPKVTPKTQDDREQARRFIEPARALECDDDKERFGLRLKKIAKAKPKDEPKPK